MSLSLPYTLKRFISQFLMPVPVVIELFVLGWMLGRFTRFKRTGYTFQILAGCLFILFGCGWGTSYLYRHERLFAPFDPSVAQIERLRGVDVVVLGQTFAEESDLPVRYRANASMLLRLLEGVRVARLIPESRLLVSMAGAAAEKEKSDFLDEFALTAGIPRQRMVMFTGARDTADEAQLAVARARTNTIVIATSAAHMPRAQQLFKQRGVNPIPAPCDYQMISNQRQLKWTALPLPSGNGFAHAEGAVYEWLGSLYERLRN